MTRKKIGKVLLVWLCIITLLMPFTSEVLAAALSNDATEAILESIPYRQGGKESTGKEYSNYDKNSYAYKISDTNVLKVVQADDTSYSDTFYCINAERSLSVKSTYNYKKVADDFSKLSNTEVEKWVNSVGISEDNFKALVYLLKNLYAKKLDTSYKDTLIENAFANIFDDEIDPPVNVEFVKEYLTDDDIDVIQQWAIWYFTNGSNNSNINYKQKYDRNKYSKDSEDNVIELPSIELTKIVGIDDDNHPITDTQNLSSIRKKYADILYNYLIESALLNVHNMSYVEDITYPSIDRSKDLKMEKEGEYFKAGPFKVNSGTVTPSDFSVVISTVGNTLSSVNYIVKADGVDVTNEYKTSGIKLDKEYYFYLPVSGNTITGMSMKINYTPSSGRNISLWTGKDDTQNLQPLVLLTNIPGTPFNDEINAILNVEKMFDLSLKKFISNKNGSAISREPQVNVTPLKNGEIDAEYTTNKTPISVDYGDLVTFTIRVYNEGDIAGYADQITDYIPEGLGFLPQFSDNLGWTSSNYVDLKDILSDTSKINLADFNGISNLEDIKVQTSGKITTNKLSNSDESNLINAFNGINLDYKDVTVTFIVLSNDSNIIKNIAAITSESDEEKNPIDTDRTENTDSSPIDDIIPDDYTDGNEDDDDYDVVKPNKKRYDLALRKFIVSVNGVSTTGRTPVPTEDSLNDLASGNSDTAKYTHSKAPVTVKIGDKIVYEFRIYNEGDFDAKVQKIVDYLPEGLTVIDRSESTVNSKFNWSIDGNTITNTYLSNTTINKFNKETKDLSYGIVQLECVVIGELQEGKVLTNIAEILEDDGDDRDSEPGSIDKNSISEDYSGNTSNKDDLTDSSYYYKGIEDDDDFEKVIIAGKQFDLSLQKFISSVNDTKQDREPKVDVTPLKNGKDDAKYTTTKNPVNVETGDIVTFTLRVYNEGEIDGYAEVVTDYIPEGLGFLVNYNTNYDNCWSISKDSKSKNLSEIKNGKSNLKLSDFKDVQNLDDVQVVLGKSKITSTALASSTTSTANLIKAFDGTNLSYKDIEVSFIVVTEDEIVLKNIAAITKESDKDRNEVETDRGSEDRDSTPKDNIDPDKYTTGDEDDDDYDVVKTDKKNFDLALQKFITGLNDEEIKDRVPVVSVVDGKIKYTHPNLDPLTVGNGDLVTYTIRVYNEGEIDGYAAEVKDDIPTGLVFLPENEVNKKYGWKMYDKSGNETKDVKQAVTVRTTYLSKESSEDNLIKAYDGITLSYKDVVLVFKVDETSIEKTVTTEKRTLINTAEISKNTDKDGNDIPDIDSTPDNDKQGEDDIDQEKVYVKYFDLALEKNLKKAIVTSKGETTEVTGDKLKIEIHKKNIDNTSIQFVYTIKVRNEGEIEGYATEITDYIPDGLSFDKASNPDWVQVSDRIIKTEALAKTLLKPGETAEVQVILDWVKSSENIGRFVNVAEISEDWNPYDSDDVDSTPNNLIPSEDDQDDAPVWVGIVTGLGDQPYIILTTTVLVILATGVILIKKYVL